MPIIAAVDQSDRARSVIRQARELADAYEGELHVVHIRDTEGDITDEASRKALEEVDAIVEEKGDERATKIAREIAGEVEESGKFTPVGLTGDPAPALLNYAEEHDAECIVVSARKRSSLDQVLFGSVTQSLLLNADRAVVAAPHEVA
ncbi:universal stress protein [Haloterrigena salifodinae]|uniref:universal stress protein n=1 Tax=Haloterrigena salifodinae TaxID=2675099 RepID=UPI000F87E2D0|nr:universal stress protein [Haloterrigena salifodinae]